MLVLNVCSWVLIICELLFYNFFLRNIYFAQVLILLCLWIWYFDVNIFWFRPQKYLLRLESTLSKASYEYELPEISFQTNKSYKHFTFQFTPKVGVIFVDHIFIIYLIWCTIKIFHWWNFLLCWFSNIEVFNTFSTCGKCCSCSDENTFWIDMIIIRMITRSLIHISVSLFYQRKSLEQELNQGSVLALPLAILVGVAIYNYQKVNLITKLLNKLSKVCKLHVIANIYLLYALILSEHLLLLPD